VLGLAGLAGLAGRTVAVAVAAAAVEADCPLFGSMAGLPASMFARRRRSYMLLRFFPAAAGMAGIVGLADVYMCHWTAKRAR
jgi:hypothetical protein